MNFFFNRENEYNIESNTIKYHYFYITNKNFFLVNLLFFDPIT